MQGLSPEKIARLIFHSGFSTASKITHDAGRGMGLDLVKAKIEGLGGKLTIAFSPGKYCRFTIELPL